MIRNMHESESRLEIENDLGFLNVSISGALFSLLCCFCWRLHLLVDQRDTYCDVLYL